MAKNNAPAAPLLSPKDRAMRAIQAGDAAAALKVVREAHTATPTPEALADRKQVLAVVAGYFADRDKAVDFNRVMAEADQLDPTDPAWVMERACLLARGGRRDDGLARVDAADHPKILGHAVDRAVRMRTKEFLPDELKPGFDAVITGFKKHEAGDEAGSRAAVDPIGIRSPFLDWKLLIRGLLAHANADDARAAENFGRLDPTRLPARLAAPLRVAVDPAFKASLPPEVAADLMNKNQPFTAGVIVDLLRKIAKELGRDKPLTPAFRAADELLSHLKKAAPLLIPKLANCMYAAILHQGQPEDMNRYRKLFGSPPDDPHFHKLQAIIGEGMNEHEMAHVNWQKYEAWLATKPAGWPEAVATRARSLVWHRMGENALEAAAEEDEEDEDDDDDDDYMFPLFGPPRGRRDRLPRPPLKPSASECFREVNRLAPDWAEGAKHLMTSLVLEEKFDEAEAIARKFLATNPNELEMLTVVGNLLLAQGRADEAITFRLQALAVNPLDKNIRARTTFAVLAASRHHLVKGDAAAANALLEQHQSLVEDQPGPLAVLRSTILTKRGQSAEAVAARAQALAIENFRLAGAYRIAVDGILAKLKPAEKKVTDKVFTSELAKPPTPGELVQLLASLEMYEAEGVTYRGQKTHAKKAIDLVAKLKATNGTEIDFERVAEMLVIRQEWKAGKKYTDQARRWFPRNPIFPMLRAKIGHELNESPYSLMAILHEARHNAESSTDPRFKAMTERIDEIQGEVGSPMDLFDMFFRGRRR